MNWMSWMKIFDIKLMDLHIKINKLLVGIVKVVLIKINPTVEPTYHKTYRVTLQNLIDMFK